MAIITISRSSYSQGKEIAEKVAKKLGYECVAREILLGASEEYNVPEIKLVRSIHDAPSLFNRLSYKKEHYMAYIQAEILDHFKRDNLVYHGLGGHFFVSEISHVLKVRIIAGLQERIRLEIQRENISKEEAKDIILKDDEERRKWSQYLYGIDTRDASLYDLVLHLHKLTIDDAVDIICCTAKLKQFESTEESQKAIKNLALAAQAKASLMDLKQDLKVSAQDGTILVKTEAPVLIKSQLEQEIKDITQTIPGVRETKVDIFPSGAEALG
jgi:cytidylate kinase